MKQVEVAAIAVDASTQTRERINEAVVATYAERMLDGVQFPPIVLFHDGNHYYIGDGFHRVLAAQRNGAVTMSSDVRPGTREDALWFALGANREHGHQMTSKDKRHAITLALQTWPTRSGAQIAEQVGCSPMYVSTIKAGLSTTLDLPDRVVGRDGVSYPASTSAKSRTRADVASLLKAGKSEDEIRAVTKVGRDVVREIKRSLGIGRDQSREAVAGRAAKMRDMAADGHTSRQIAAAVGMTEEGCRSKMRTLSIDVPADRAMGATHRHDSNRIVDRMVADAENLTADVNLIEFSQLDRERIGEWIDTLIRARGSLNGFIKQLIKEKEKHGQAA